MIQGAKSKVQSAKAETRNPKPGQGVQVMMNAECGLRNAESIHRLRRLRRLPICEICVICGRTPGLRIAILLLLLACSVVTATRYAGDFEELGVSARAVGMGSAFVAAGADPSAMYYNPAASALSEQRSVLLMHSENFGGLVKNDFASLILPAQNSAYGLGLLHNGVFGIKLTELRRPDLPLGAEYTDTTVNGAETTFAARINTPVVSRTVNAGDWLLYLNYARAITRGVLVGGNAKVIYRTTGASSCFGMGLDLGATVVLARDFNVGLRVRNLTTSPLFWDTRTRESMDPRPVLGLAKGFTLARDHHVLVSIEAEGNFEGLPIEENLGAEYRFRNLLCGRLGFHRGNFTFGLGGEYRGFFLDYAYESAPYRDAGDPLASQRIAGGLRF